MLHAVDGMQWGFWSHFPVPFAKEPVKTLGHCLCAGLSQALWMTLLSVRYLPDVACGLCRRLLHMERGCPARNTVVGAPVSVSAAPLCDSELPLNTQALSIVLLRRLCFPPALFSQASLLLGLHYGAWFLSLFCGPTAFCVRPLYAWARGLCVLLCYGDGKEGFLLCFLK